MNGIDRVDHAGNDNRKRCITFPIDGAVTAENVLCIAKNFVKHKELMPYVAMIKLNDALHIPKKGPDIINDLRDILPDDIGIFIDLKIGDVSETVKNTLRHYAIYAPDIVTVSSIVTAEGLLSVREILPHAKIALVDTLTDMSERECMTRFSGSMAGEKIAKAIKGYDNVFVHNYENVSNPIDIIVSSVVDVPHLNEEFSAKYQHLCPGIRDVWMLEGNNSDHQNRVAGTYAALALNTRYLVMGSQLTKGNPRTGVTAEESLRLTVLELERYFS